MGRARGHQDDNRGGQVIFGRKRKPVDSDSDIEGSPGTPGDDGEVADVVDDAEVLDADLAEELEDDEDEDDDEDDDEQDLDDAEADEEAEAVDWRADGPFDSEEVDLGGDDVARIDLGSLVVTPWEGLGLQLQVNEASREVQAVTAVWKNSGLEVALFAAPASGGMADELREDVVEEAEQGGGTATLADGPFGTEVRRVLPQEGPGGEQLFHVSRIWYAEGPRWLLRGTLLGEAAIGDADAPLVAPFAEFFRNLVVRRGSKPMVPGELVPMTLPEAAGEA